MACIVSDSHTRLQELGLPDAETLLARYFEKRGLPYPDPNVKYYLGFYWWKVREGVRERAGVTGV